MSAVAAGASPFDKEKFSQKLSKNLNRPVDLDKAVAVCGQINTFTFYIGTDYARGDGGAGTA